jgi:ABC-type branched-subunit amino acid transport system substrate-binding protein
VTDPTVDSQIATLQASGAEVFASFSTPKATSQAIRRAFDTGWKPKIIIPLIVAQIDGTLRPAGLDKSVGVISEVAIKDAVDPQWAKDPDMIAFQAWQKKYNTQVTDPALAASGYNSGFLIAQVIKQAGDDLTRENIMKQAENLTNVHPPMNLPGIDVNTSPDNFRLARQVQFQMFNGTNWELIGSPVSD